MIDENDMQQILDRAIEKGDNRYRKIEDCEEITEEEHKIDEEIKKDLAEIKILQVKYNTKFDILIGVVSGIGALILPVAVKFLFGG